MSKVNLIPSGWRGISLPIHFFSTVRLLSPALFFTKITNGVFPPTTVTFSLTIAFGAAVPVFRVSPSTKIKYSRFSERAELSTALFGNLNLTAPVVEASVKFNSMSDTTCGAFLSTV